MYTVIFHHLYTPYTPQEAIIWNADKTYENLHNNGVKAGFLLKARELRQEEFPKQKHFTDRKNQNTIAHL